MKIDARDMTLILTTHLHDDNAMIQILTNTHPEKIDMTQIVTNHCQGKKDMTQIVTSHLHEGKIKSLANHKKGEKDVTPILTNPHQENKDMILIVIHHHRGKEKTIPTLTPRLLEGKPQKVTILKPTDMVEISQILTIHLQEKRQTKMKRHCLAKELDSVLPKL